MKQKLLFALFILSVSTLIGQSIKRIDVKGVIITDENDIEGITVFNMSTNQGTVTNVRGEFTIALALNDRIEVSALQFQSVSIIVDKDVVTSEFLKIKLIEQVNQLDAVVLSSGLSGNLIKDVNEVKTVKPITINMGNMNVAFEYNDEKAFDNSVIVNELKSITNKGEFYNGVNFNEISKLIFKPKKKALKVIEHVDMEQPTSILSVYSEEFINTSFNIPLENIDAFVAFVSEKGLEPQLLESKNEMQLIEFLVKQSDLFLKLQDVKN